MVHDAEAPCIEAATALSALNEITAETLRVHVDEILSQPPFDDQPTISRPVLAPFITFFQLSNLRGVVVHKTNASTWSGLGLAGGCKPRSAEP